MIVRLLLCLGVVSLAALAGAQTPSGEAPRAEGAPGAVFSDSTVVTASRVPQPGSAVPANVIVITATDIERSTAQTLDELLRRIPGFSQLHQADSHVSSPQTRTASLRGLGGGNSRALVLVDGVPLNDPFGGVVYWSRIPLDSIARIEVIRSGASGVWGNLALGGVIHILTKSGQADGPHVSGAFEGGTNSTGDLSVSAQAARGRWRASGGVGLYRTDGYLVLPAAQAGPIDEPVASATEALNGKLQYAPSPTQTWTVGGSYYNERFDAGSPLAENTVELGGVHVQGAFSTGRNRWQVTSFVTHQNSTAVNSTLAADRRSETLSGNQFDVPGTAVGVNAQWWRVFDTHHLLSAGLDAQRTDLTLKEDFNFSAGRLTRRRRAESLQWFHGAYVEDLMQITDRWHVVASARVDRWTLSDFSRRETDLLTQAVLRNDQFPDRTVTTVNPGVGTVWRVSDRTVVRGSVYRGFRAPTPNELSRPFRSRGNVITESNPQLAPERLLGTEAGVEFMVRDHLAAKVTAFVDELDNAITAQTIAEAGATTRQIAPCGTVPAGGSCRQRANFGTVRSRGVESELRFQPQGPWAAGVSYLFDPSRIVDNPAQPALVGLLNRQSPIHQVSVDASYSHPRWLTLSAVIRSVSHRFDDDLNTSRLAPFSTVDLRAARRVARRLDLFVSIRNLGNVVIESTKAGDGTIGLGNPRLVHAGARVSF